MRSSLMSNANAKAMIKHLRDVGCEVDHRKYAGTVIAKDGDKTAFRAIQKGRGGPWIATFYNTDRITWKWSDDGSNAPASDHRELGGVPEQDREHTGDAQGDSVSVPPG